MKKRIEYTRYFIDGNYTRIYLGSGRWQYEHRHIAEKALGRKLKNTEIVHHANGDKADNRNENLVVCPDEEYHHLLHLRKRAWEAGCPLYYRLCFVCHEYDDPANMRRAPNEHSYYHFLHYGKGAWRKDWQERYDQAIQIAY